MQIAFSPPELSHRIASLHGERWSGSASSRQRSRKDHIAVLEAKADAIRANIPGWLNFIGLPDDDHTAGTWTVATAVVTPNPSPAAFVQPPRGFFVLSENIPDVLHAVGEQHAGFAWMPPLSA